MKSVLGIHEYRRGLNTRSLDEKPVALTTMLSCVDAARERAAQAGGVRPLQGRQPDLEVPRQVQRLPETSLRKSCTLQNFENKRTKSDFFKKLVKSWKGNLRSVREMFKARQCF